MKHADSSCSFRSNVMCVSYGFNTRKQTVLMQEEEFCQHTARVSSLEHKFKTDTPFCKLEYRQCQIIKRLMLEVCWNNI